jgi:hypothetical protein
MQIVIMLRSMDPSGARMVIGVVEMVVLFPPGAGDL